MLEPGQVGPADVAGDDGAFLAGQSAGEVAEHPPFGEIVNPDTDIDQVGAVPVAVEVVSPAWRRSLTVGPGAQHGVGIDHRG